MGKLAISLLGVLRVTLDGVPINAFETDKARALLAYLAVESQQPHSREALAELLWPDHPEGHDRRNLSQALYSLRSLLREPTSPAQPLFLTTAEAIQLSPAGDTWVDVDEFTHLIDTCNRHPHNALETCEPCQERFQRAVSLYQGDFLTDFSIRDSAAFDEWCHAHRERYRLLARRALNSLAESYRRGGQISLAIETTWRLAELDPLDEDACRRLMQLLDVSGKRSEALSIYENYRRKLEQELDVAPDKETRALYERIRTEERQPTATPARQHNLPTTLGPLIGREAELAEVQSRLLDPICRLLTVIGPGGSGKSRLALEVAHGLRGSFSDGVFLVNLSPLTSPEAFLPSLAEAVSLQFVPQKPPLGQIQDYLSEKELLLVLDGCEGRLEAVTQLLELIHAAPALKVLATSRVRLNAKNEEVYWLQGLECPTHANLEAAAASPAVRLFASGARRVQSGFDLDPHSLLAVVEICCNTQGMPLAILLAAAWAELLSPAEILSEMNRSLDFLQTEWADLPARQRSVRASFDHSWKLLGEKEQAVFQALCVFRGKFTRGAAEQVGEATASMLRRLVDKSFLMAQTGDRYAIHSLLRQFGLEKLGAQRDVSNAIRWRYSNYFLDKLVEWEIGLKGAQQLETLAILDTKINDLRQAWEWAAANHDIDRLEHGLEGLGLYYELRTRFIEGKSLCQETGSMLAPAEEPQQKHLLAHLAAWESRFCRLLGERELAHQRLEAGQALVDELFYTNLETRDVQALIHLETGEEVFTADLAEARQCLEHSLELYRQLGDPWRTAGVLCRLGFNRHHAGDYARSERLMNEALELYQEIGDRSGVATAQGMIAQNQFRLGQTVSALDLMRRVVAFSQASGDRAQAMKNTRALGLALGWNGMLDEEAHQLLNQALALAEDLGSRYDIAFTHLALGFFGFLTGQYDFARRHIDLTLELARRDGFRREIAASLFSLGCIALTESTPQEAQPLFQESLTLYRQIGHPDELGWALSLDAFCCLACGETEPARLRLVEALGIACSIHAYLSALFALTISAIWLGKQGEGEKAMKFYHVAAAQPLFANSAWFHELFEKRILAYTAGLSPEEVAAAQERGKQRQLWPSIEELYQLLSAAG